jgi:hypothetical protein
MLRGEHNLGIRYGHNTMLSTKDGIQQNLLDIAQDVTWAKLGGPLNDKIPEGIVLLRKALNAHPFNVKGIDAIVRERAERWGVTRFVLAVPSRATDFYKLVKEYCDMLAQKVEPDISVFQQFLYKVRRFTLT